MVKKIVWSPLAIRTYDSTIEYILHKFGEVAVKKLVTEIDDKIRLISSRPKMFRASIKRKNTYITSINRKLTLIYRYQPEKNKWNWLFFGACRIPKENPVELIGNNF